MTFYANQSLYCITLHIYVQKVILHTTNKEAEHFMFIFRFKKAFPNKKQNFYCKRTPTYMYQIGYKYV